MRPLLHFGLMALFLAVLCGWTLSVAQTNPMEEAARNFWLENNRRTEGFGNFKFDRITPQGKLVVFERLSPASFIILMQAGEDFVVVGYSFRNLFFGNPSGEAKQAELLSALTTAGQMDWGRLKGTRTLSGPVGPLIRTQWGQGRFFNYFCPRDARGPNGRVYAGCVAVAMGQIIRYYGNYNSINLETSYNSGYYGNLSVRLGPYDWPAMEDSPITVDLGVSDFLYDLGVLLHMSYGASGSSTNSHRTLEAFHELGYIGGIILRKSKFTPESWSEVFYQNLSEYKPVLVTGGGHAFICDGYNMEGLFHFNMGWDGYGDGFYPLSCVMTLPVNEAFTELEPISWPDPPTSIGLITVNRDTFVTWGSDQDQYPMLSRVYADDRLLAEITDTLFNVNLLSPGIHAVHVSAVYPDGESRWIGPVEVFVKGKLLTVKDPLLFQVIRRSLGYGMPETQEKEIYEGDLSRIQSLDIDQPLTSMEGLGLCNHLRRLVILGSPGLALDAGPLEDLSGLRVLEWNDRPMVHPETLAGLTGLVELRIRKTPLESLGFLGNFNSLMKFEYSDAPAGNPEAVSGHPLLDELVLRGTNLSNAGFVSQIPQLLRLDLSGNHLTETGFLSGLSKLDQADLSGNHLTSLLLTDQLQSLEKLDVSENEISRISITAELKALRILDLSGNRLVSPGRLFLYTPGLEELDLSNNRLRDMGKQRCQNLENLNVSDNQLITTEWVSLQPRLKKLNVEHNRISDLSGMIRNNLYRQLGFLGLDQNPLSKQSFLEWLPLLMEAIDSVSKPVDYQPLSPCYLSPANGTRMQGPEAEMKWVADNTCQKCVYDLFIVRGDSLVPAFSGLDSCRAVLSQRPPGTFSWVVASRTADSVYYSGINDVVSTAEWKLPFREGFEGYREGDQLSEQSDCWLITDSVMEPGGSAQIVASNFRTGNNSLELAGGESAILSMEHLDLPYVSIRFSVLIPPGQQGEFRVQNMNGMYYRFAWNASNTGRFYVNDKLYGTFTVDHQNWTDYEVMGHARNNSFHVKAGSQLLINEPLMFPEGIICTESIGFSSFRDDHGSGDMGNRIYIDDVSITSATGSLYSGDEPDPAGTVSVFPNPCADYIQISFSRSGRYPVSITDISGREVFREMIDAPENSFRRISMAGLAPGVYVLQAGGGNSRPLKVLKSPAVY